MNWTARWRLPRRRMTLANGLELAYVDVPPVATSGADLTILLLHGFTNDADSWADLIPALQQHLPQARLLIPDLRGHGASGLPPDDQWRTDPVTAFSLANQAHDIAELLATVVSEPTVVVGHSMGSLVAVELAASHPQQIVATALLSTTIDARGTPFLSDWLRDDVFGTWRATLTDRGTRWPDEAMAVTPLEIDADAVGWMQRLWNLYPLDPHRSTIEQAQRSARLPIAVWVGANEAIVTADVHDPMERLAVPVLVLWGTQDSFFRHDQQRHLIDLLDARALRSGVPFAWKQYGEIPLPDNGIQADDIGHNLTWDAAEQVAIDIAAWISTGVPTTNWYRSDAPQDQTRIVVDDQPAPLVTWP